MQTIATQDRKSSHYISGAAASMNCYPDICEAAGKPLSQRTSNFLEVHDLESYIAANKENGWISIPS